MGENRNTFKVSVGKPEGKRPLGTHQLRWANYIKMDFKTKYDWRQWTRFGWHSIGTSGTHL